MKRIAVHSSAGGVGKSFVSANLAYSLFRSGVNVALCDLSCEQSMLMYFGSSVFSSNSDVSQLSTSKTDSEISESLGFSCYRLHDCFLVYALKGGSDVSLESRLESALKIYEHKSHVMDALILDIPTNLSVSKFQQGIDVLLEVVAADPMSLSTAISHHASQGLVSGDDQEINRLVVVNKKDLRSQVLLDASHTAEIIFNDSLISSIHYDTAVPESYANKVLLHDYSPECQANLNIEDLASSLVDTLKIKNRQKDTA